MEVNQHHIPMNLFRVMTMYFNAFQIQLKHGLLDRVLHQAMYPNPFNPSTVIRFAIPKTSRVNIQIFNITGELVSTLLNSEKPQDIMI